MTPPTPSFTPLDPALRAPRDLLARWRRRGLVLAVLAGALSLIGALLDPSQFFRSYLLGYVFWWSIALGCLAIEMLEVVAPGGWGVIIRRPMEAGSRTIAPLGVLFVPILFGLPRLYVWARPEAVLADPVLAHKAVYMSVPFFVVRTMIYFAAWSGFALWLSRLSLSQDRGVDLALERRMRKVSAAGLVVYGLTLTLASVDWLMSLQPHWYSTIFGIYVLGGQGVAALSLAVLVTLALARRLPMSRLVRPRHFHDLGKMLLAFVMLWAYFAFSQFLVIWAGDLPKEIPYYMSRARGPWGFVSVLLVLFHFALPLLLLLSRDLKRSGRRLSIVAALLLVMHWVDVYWLVAPSLSPDHLVFHWLDITTTVFVGGVWLVLFTRGLGQRSIVPVRDPLYTEAVAND